MIKKNLQNRILGSLLGAFIFYIVTNFGVWSLGSYGYSIKGVIECYTLAIPFFTNTIISTFLFTILLTYLIKYIETLNIVINKIITSIFIKT